jgi:hypothetical protein
VSPDVDAVRARYLEAVARRLQTAPEAVQRALHARLAPQAEAGADAGEPAPVEAPVSPRRPRPQSPKPATPLAALNLYIAAASRQPGASARSELRSAQAFRETWSRICAEDEVNEAVQRGPDNAGPLNSHMLVLRTLGLLRELSPDYLRRFMGHADTLLWLDQAGGRLKTTAGKGKPARQKK